VFRLSADRNLTLSLYTVLVGGVKAFADPGKKALRDRAATVQQGGMSAIAAAVTTAGTSEHTKASRPLETSVVRASLLTTPADGYAAACLALADATEPDYSAIKVPTLILAGSEDKTCPKPTVEFLTQNINGAKVVDISNIGHWHE
jgi:pimeloyl-ACP methyl ester carboxylesterase